MFSVPSAAGPNIVGIVYQIEPNQGRMSCFRDDEMQLSGNS
jgi:hypothetical protein